MPNNAMLVKGEMSFMEDRSPIRCRIKEETSNNQQTTSNELPPGAAIECSPFITAI
jgi:hypothetical protein